MSLRNKRIISKVVLVVLFYFQVNCIYSQSQPNIVLIFTDDAGYADFGFQGSTKIRTPHLDRLSEEGVVFEQGYVSAATCGPSRAGLITGKYQQRFGYEENNVPGYMSPNSGLDGEDMGVPLSEVTMGERLKSLGYATAFIGKWHLGSADRYHPMNRGFDYFYGFRGGDRSYFPYKELPAGHFADKKMERGIGVFEEPDQYASDAFADEAIAFIANNKDNPFFVFLSFNAVHTPIEALPEDLAQFTELQGLRKELAAMTLAMDRACGRLFEQLDELKLTDNTLIVFTNDNGGPTDKNGSNNYPLSGTKSNHLEGGIRVPYVMKWPGKIEPGSTYPFPVSTLDLLPTFYSAGGGDLNELSSIDGVDLIPFVTNENKNRPHQKLFWKKENRAAIRDGDWKLIRHIDRPAELFDLSKDLSEQNDLAFKYPDLTKSMFKALYEWELTLERPLWLLKRKYEKYDIDRMDKYRKAPLSPD